MDSRLSNRTTAPSRGEAGGCTRCFVERTPFCFHVQLSAPSGGGRDRLAFFARSRDELTRWVGSLQLASSIPLNDLGTSEIHRVIALLSDL